MILIIFIISGFSTLFIKQVFAFNSVDQKIINKIILDQEFQNQKLDSKTIEYKSIENLITSIDFKKNVADEKEAAYDKAINQLKWWITGFGFLISAILIFFGIMEDKRLKDKKKELSEELEIKKKELDTSFKEQKELLVKEAEIKVKEEMINIKEQIRTDISEQFKELRKETNTDIDNVLKEIASNSTIKNTKEEDSYENEITSQKEIDI